MEIKPCPFCGSSNCEEIYQNGRDEGWIVRCNSCGATGSVFAYDQDAVGKWNDVSLAGSPEWRPIDDAPKNGTAILVMRNIWPETPLGYAEECDGSNTYVAEWQKDGWVCYMDSACDPLCPINPTHWMPLPPPPKP